MTKPKSKVRAKPKAVPPLDTVNRPALAKLLGVSIKTVDSWRSRGVPEVKTPRGFAFVVADVVKWLQERSAELAIASGKRPDGAIDLQDLKERRAQADTELAELALEEARGEVIPRDIALEVFGDALTRLRSKILAIPSRYAGRWVKIKTAAKLKIALREASLEILDELTSSDDIVDEAAKEGKVSGGGRGATRPRHSRNSKGKAPQAS